MKLPSTWEVNGWRLRLDQGRKHADDIRIWVASPGGDFSLLTLASLGAITKLWYENEARLYPNGAGGEYVLSFLRKCCTADLRTACREYKLRDPQIERIADDLEQAA